MQYIKAQPWHCKHCIEVLVASLTKKAAPKWPQNSADPQVPIFVTWTTVDDQLRGCIGTFSPSRLSTLLPQYALISALKDSRFPPIRIQQVQNLTVAVSLLINFEKNKNAFDWEIGKHGIVIEFQDQGRNYSGTFLPQVAAEQGWTKQTTLTHLIRKAGSRTPLQIIAPKIRLTTYQSSKAHLSYKQYLQQL